MRRLFSFCCTMLLAVNISAKTLVVYYSYTNNCHEIVTSLTSQIQADVMRIEPADKTQKYEANNYAIGTALLNAIKAAPNEAASYPAIDPVSITDLSQYQNIIIVTPLWWSQMAAILKETVCLLSPILQTRPACRPTTSATSSARRAAPPPSATYRMRSSNVRSNCLSRPACPSAKSPTNSASNTRNTSRASSSRARV